ncbi:MAG: transglycosylase SLT domain-containing protein [Candidatus Caenarcaniphilales bacterium]|nr:transglycosylase SLT domain-containing protein [Candidatus Caenarcaniphilales bacterium]
MLAASYTAIIAACLTAFFIFFQPFNLFMLSSESKYLDNYSPFKPNNKLAAAIKTLPSDKKLAKEQLEELKKIVSPANDARRLYILAQVNQKAGNMEEAFEQYTSIKRKYVPYLADRTLLHIAETSEELGYEKAVVNSCNEIIKKHPYSLSRPAAHYLIARSYLRQKKLTEAKKIFKKLRLKYPTSQYATGALYYLGNLSSNSTERNQLWTEYLSKSPDGRFSNEIVFEWSENLDELNNTQKSLMGLHHYKRGHFNDDQNEPPSKAYKLIYAESNELTWIPIANLQLQNKEKAKAQRTLLNGLKKYTDSKDFKDALNLLFRNASFREREGFVEELLPKYDSQVDKAAYILWRQAAFYKPNSNKRKAIYHRLIDQLPQSKYAGAASAEIFWKIFKSKNFQAAKNFGYKHLENYANLSESAKVFFWLAKQAESENRPQKAKTLYKKILSIHEDSYYAFRAKGRLVALSGGQDPGWALNYDKDRKTLNLRRHYDNNDHWVWQIPETELKKLHPTIQELLSLNLWQETLTLLPSNYQEEFPGLHSWVLARIEENIIKSTSIASNQLEEKEADFESHHDYWLLSFPFVYFEHAQESANRHRIDPLLVQSLMRQESRFQHKIVSRSNAIGLCQLLPSTAKEVARQINYPVPDFNRLKIPSYNIELGTKYLSGLRNRFNGQNQLAVAAYNGGPGSVSRWLRRKGNMDPDMFVETIPFNETRNYVIYVFRNYWIYQNLANRIYASNEKITLSKNKNSQRFNLQVDYPSTVQ